MSCDTSEFETGGYPADELQRIEAIAGHYREIIKLIGENPEREGLLKTPMRAAIFEYAGSRMVVVKDIEFYSFCEHHILPFFGTVSIGYIPDGSMIGLSKLPRLVNAIARKLQVQERLTAEICREVTETLSAKGVIVVCNARHLCMQMRGVEKQMAVTDTIDYSGEFVNNTQLRQEFFAMISR